MKRTWTIIGVKDVRSSCKWYPEYVPWTDVEKVDFDRPPAMYPPLGGG